MLAGHAQEVAVSQSGPPDNPRLQVTVTGEAVTDAVAPAVTLALEQTLSIRRDLRDFYTFAASDPRLGPLAEQFRGLKPPRFPTLFECLVNAIACQQVTLTFGIQLLNQLSEAYGPVFFGEDGPMVGLPQPETLATVDPEDLRALQFSRQKARALTELAGIVVQGKLDLEAMIELDEEAVRTHLCQLWGVGRWTVEYALLRGLGRLHIFPGDDVGARNGLERWLGLSEKLDYEGVRRTLAGWSPYAGLIYFHLLLNRHAKEGYLSP